MNKLIISAESFAALLFLGACTQETTSPSNYPVDSINNEVAGFSCKTESLLDNSGIKIICGGDSIGVVYNGANGSKGDDGEKGSDGTSCVILPLDNMDAHKLVCGSDSIGVLYNGTNGADGVNGIDGKDGTNGTDGADGLDGVGCTSTPVTEEITGKTGVLVQCGDDEPVYVWNGTNGTNGVDGTNGADGTSCNVLESVDLGGFDVYCGGVKVGTIQNGQDGARCTSSAVTDTTTGKSGVRIQCGDDEPTYIWDGANGTANTIEELSDKCKTIRSTKNDFITIFDIFPCVRSNEKVAFIIRHAERDRNSSGETSTLNEAGRVQSLDLGEKLRATADFFYMSTNYNRNKETVLLIARGKGQTIADSATLYNLNEDQYYLQNLDLLESWYVEDKNKIADCQNPESWGWSAYSKFAYEEENIEACGSAFYDVDDRTQELITKYFTYENMHDITMAISHDQFLVPFLVAISNRQLDLRFHDHENDFDYWINYLTGAAIIVDSDNQVTTIPVKSLDNAYLHTY